MAGSSPGAEVDGPARERAVAGFCGALLNSTPWARAFRLRGPHRRIRTSSADALGAPAPSEQGRN